jgi:hypothetical protein
VAPGGAAGGRIVTRVVEGNTGARRRPALIGIGLVMLLAATAFVLVGLGRGVMQAPNTAWYSSETLTTPIDTTLDLGRGGYQVFQNTGLDGVRPVTLGVGDIDVLDPDGVALRLERSAARSMNQGEDVFTSVAFFRVQEDGVYRLRVTPSDGGSAQVFVNDDGRSTFLGRDSYAMRPAVLGALLAAAGIGVLAAGFTKRVTRPVLAAPGWYPDPAEPTHLRWFDGVRWTERRSGPPPDTASLEVVSVEADRRAGAKDEPAGPADRVEAGELGDTAERVDVERRRVETKELADLMERVTQPRVTQEGDAGGAGDAGDGDA